MSSEVTFKIKIEGSSEVKNVTVDAVELSKAFTAVQTEVKNLNSQMVSLASTINVLESVSNMIGDMRKALTSLSDAYSQQEVAEARLAQAMRNTMGASDEEIQSIKDLAAEQQKIGQFFLKYDSLISAQQKEIDKLKDIKKSLLQKMFV